MKKSLICALTILALSYVVFPGNKAVAADASIALNSTDVTITNNVGKADTIYVTGVVKGDVITVYSNAGKVLATKSVTGQNTSATISLAQIGVSAGTIYMTVTSTGQSESSWTTINYPAEGVSEDPIADNVTVTNNSGKADTIYIYGLAPGDVVNFYTAATDGKLLGSSTVSANKTDATKSISQLGVDDGSIYISVKSKGMHESNRVEVDYSGEDKTTAIDEDNVTITNNSGSNDKIYISGLAPKDKIQIYNQASGGSVVATATVASGKTDVTVSLSQLATNSGYIYISNTSSGMQESKRTKIRYSGEVQAGSISSDNVTITNNSGTSDVISITGLTSGDTVNVYNASSDGSLLGSGTASSDGTAIIKISQLGTSSGTVYISAKASGKLESNRTAVDYSAESQSSALTEENIIVTNNPTGTSDTVYVSELNAGDVIKVYDSISGASPIGTATVASGSTDATISITQLGKSAGSVYITRTESGKSVSSKVQVDYFEESKSKALDTDGIVVTNNVGADDTVQVSGVSSNQVIKVYDAAKSGNLLGSSTVSSGSTSATVTISQLGSSAGSVYVSLTDTNKRESDRVEAAYSSESSSNALSASNISVTNRSGSSDTVTVTGASQKDVINVYDLAKGGTLLGTATVASGATKATVSIDQLSTDAGSIYVSRTSSNKSESSRVKVDYDAEPKSTAPSASNIVVTNNAAINDTVEVKGLSVGDEVQVYDSASGGTVLGSATVESGSTEATVLISQLGTDAGNIYITTTSTNKAESDRTQVSYIAEAQSTAPNAGKITITNNSGKAGIVRVAGLTNGDIVKVYDSATSSNVLGSGTVGTYDTSVSISVTQLGEDAGNIYVTVTSKGKIESSRTQAAYLAKTQSTAPSTSSITVINNSGLADTVKVTGLQPSDIINVYNYSSGGESIGTVTVGSSAYEGTVSISQLGSSGGRIYVSITSSGKIESSRTEVEYGAEAQSDPLDSGDVTITNNSGTADAIVVTGVSEGDVVKVYNASTGGTAIGTATVASGESEVAVSVSQLGTSAGTAYVSVIRSGKTESSRTAVTYVAESTAPVAGNIAIVNNADIADTITVAGLVSNDIVKIYDSATGGNLIGQASVAANSNTAKVTVSQLTKAAGSVYITVTEFGKGESKRTKADYIAEQTSAALYSGNVEIINNPSGTADTITVSNLSGSDVIKVYDASTGGNLIGKATVSSSGNQVTITISQISTAAGNIYISVTNVGKNESSRIEVGYTSES